jgi:hypothetical protein
MDGRGEANVGLIIAGGDAPELLEIAEEVLDQVESVERLGVRPP